MDTLPEELLVSILESLYHEDFRPFTTSCNALKSYFV
jgi:hypothetical protein